jgi:hypothetical protein
MLPQAQMTLNDMMLEADMATACNQPIYFNAPEKTTVLWEDLKIALPNICRYGGFVKWSLAKHSWLCIRLAQHRGLDSFTIAYVGAHDLHECYIGDMTSGMKQYVPGFRNIEAHWERYVHDQLGLPFADRPKDQVKYIDLLALMSEMRGSNFNRYEVGCHRGLPKPSASDMEIFNEVAALGDAEAADLTITYLQEYLS